MSALACCENPDWRQWSPEGNAVLAQYMARAFDVLVIPPNEWADDAEKVAEGMAKMHRCASCGAVAFTTK